MKIALDLRDYTCGIKRGIYFYAQGLFEALKKYDLHNQYVGIKDYPLKSWRDRNRLFAKFWDISVLPFFLREKEIDVLHFTSPNETDFNFTKASRLMGFKTITTIHDIIPYIFPKELLQTLPANVRATFETQFQMALKSDHLIAISQATKKDLVDKFKIDPQKISVVYQCNHDERFHPRSESEYAAVLEKYHLPKGFLLNPSGKDFHKNFDNIVAAYSQLPQSLREKHALVVQANLPELELRRRQELLQKLGVESNVFLLGDIQEEEAPFLFNAAVLVVAASFYEGFGLAPLEAFASGTAVIAGNNSSQPEVCEEAALLVDCYDPTKIREAMERLLIDEHLRADLIQKGFEQTKKFSQERRVRETVEVYQKVLMS